MKMKDIYYIYKLGGKIMVETILNDDLYFNIIGINEIGKTIISNVSDKYFESVLNELNNERCYRYLYPS